MPSYGSYQRHRTMSVGSFVASSPPRQLMSRTLNGACVPGPWTYGPGSTVQVGSVMTKEIYDCKTPRFQTLRKSGFVNPLPLFVETKTTTRSAAPFVHTRGRKIAPCAGVATSTANDGPTRLEFAPTLIQPGPDLSVLGVIVNRAVADARQASWDVLTDMAELRETINLFREGIAVSRKSVNEIAMKSVRYIKRPKQFAKAVADGWLTYRYGVMPVVYSLQEAIEVFNRKKREYAFGRASATTHGSLSKTHSGLGNTKVVSNLVENLNWTYTYRAQSLATFEYLSDSFRFDPLSTAYELVTLSFVLDWFVDVGTWLEAISPFSNGSTRFIYGSLKLESVYTQTHSQYAIDDATTFGTGSMYYEPLKIETRSYDRFPTSTSLPSWNPRINLPRIADAVSLAGNLRSFARRTLRI